MAINISRNETCNTGYLKDSRLCSTCEKGYSQRKLSGACDKCPTQERNYLFSLIGICAGIVGLFVFVRITLSDAGNIDAEDGLKGIGMSFIQLLSY